MSIIADKTYSISEAARLLDRSPQTLRSWDKKLPKHLKPKRDKQGNRVWTDELIEEIKEWIEENNFYPGRGIAYDPTPERLQRHIERIRRSSSPRLKSIKNAEPAPMAELRHMVETAIDELNVNQDAIVAQLPKVAKDSGIELADALRVASEVFASR